jgi:uncharacterized protein YbaP (TraB family)
MNIRTRALVGAVAATVSLGQAVTASARDFAWKVTGKAGVLYLVGSVHLLTKDFYPLSPALDQAFARSDVLVEEVDLEELTSPQAQLTMLARSMLPAGQSLDTVVSRETFARVSKRVEEIGLPIEPLKRFKPWALALTLASLEWQKAGFDAELGLDRHFYDRARKDGMAVQGLETAEYQISRFDGIAMPQQERMLIDTLSELDTEMANITSLTRSWKAGDADAVERVVLQELKRDPAMYQRLLVERNKNWMPKIEALAARAGSAFIVVGAAHLVGPDGLLAMLRARGYRIEQM